jgi:hypothetical protein
MGLATANITDGVNGTVMSFGTLKDIDTRGSTASAIAVGDETWAAGDILFAHPTVDGKLTKVRPRHDLVVAFITVRHASAGQLAVRITSGNHLEWLHDVDIEDPADEQILAYDATAGLWKNIDIPESAAVISSATAPANTTAIWFNTENGNTYIYYDDFWTSIAGSTGAPIISDTAPADPVLGTQWFNSSTGKSYLYFSNAWIEIDSNGTSTASTGNAIINGAFEINQRGFTSSTASAVYTFDRWVTEFSSATPTYTAQTFSPAELSVPGFEGTNFIRIATTGATGSSYTTFGQRIENVKSFAGQVITVSLYAKALSGTPKIAVRAGQSFGAGGSGFVGTNSTTTETLDTLWKRYIFNVNVPSISGKTIGADNRLLINIVTNDNTLGSGVGLQNATIDIWGVQVEAGAVATPFRRNAPSIQAELAACQRYYQRFTGNNGYAPVTNSGIIFSSTFANSNKQLNVTMRTLPSSVEWTNLRVLDMNGQAYAVSALAISASSNTDIVGLDVTASGMNNNRYSYLTQNNSTAGFLAFSAEL